MKYQQHLMDAHAAVTTTQQTRNNEAPLPQRPPSSNTNPDDSNNQQYLSHLASLRPQSSNVNPNDSNNQQYLSQLTENMKYQQHLMDAHAAVTTTQQTRNNEAHLSQRPQNSNVTPDDSNNQQYLSHLASQRPQSSNVNPDDSNNQRYLSQHTENMNYQQQHLMNTNAAATNKSVNRNGGQQQYATGNDAYGEEQKAKVDLHSSYLSNSNEARLPGPSFPNSVDSAAPNMPAPNIPEYQNNNMEGSNNNGNTYLPQYR